MNRSSRHARGLRGRHAHWARHRQTSFDFRLLSALLVSACAPDGEPHRRAADRPLSVYREHAVKRACVDKIFASDLPSSPLLRLILPWTVMCLQTVRFECARCAHAARAHRVDA
jgi:hypothetical protein